jgi:hypothetical protein
MKKNPILIAVCCGALAMAAGCAAPGAPQPPSLRVAMSVDNLSATRKGDRVLLTWSTPTETTDHQSMRWPTTTRICRVLNQFPINTCGEVVKELKSSELATAVPGARRPLVSFEDILPEALIGAQNQATYAIEVVNQRGKSAGLSNQLRISLVPTEPPPANFHATLDAQGPLLHWDVVSTFAPSPAISYRLRIYRRSGGKQGFALVGEEPYRLGEGEARDSSFEWEQAYEYKIAAVTAQAQAKRPEVEVEGDDSRLVQLNVHDTFPPAVPSGLQAVFSSVGQKPSIDLTWAPDTESDLAGYIVYRSTGGSGTGGSGFVKVSSTTLKAPAWRDTDINPGQKYYYAVSAIDVRGNQSAQSAATEESVPLEVR